MLSLGVQFLGLRDWSRPVPALLVSHLTRAEPAGLKTTTKIVGMYVSNIRADFYLLALALYTSCSGFGLSGQGLSNKHV